LLEDKSILWYDIEEFTDRYIATMEVGNRGSIYVPVGFFAQPLELRSDTYS